MLSIRPTAPTFLEKKVLALLDANCTTERTQLNRGGTRVRSACERVSADQSVANLRFLLQRKIVLHRAARGAGIHVHGCSSGQGYIDGAGMIAQPILAGVPEIAVITNVAIGGADRKFGRADDVHCNFTAGGENFDVPAIDVAESDRAIHGLHMEMRVGNVTHLDLGGVGPQG